MKEEPFDFDVWSNLAQKDPEAFEAKRLEKIENLIQSAPEELRPRLRSFQWRIDMERQRCSTPLQACIRISNMMWDIVYADRGFLWAMQIMSDPHTLLEVAPQESRRAEVVRLRPER
jgi:hypothetical protein